MFALCHQYLFRTRVPRVPALYVGDSVRGSGHLVSQRFVALDRALVTSRLYVFTPDENGLRATDGHHSGQRSEGKHACKIFGQCRSRRRMLRKSAVMVVIDGRREKTTERERHYTLLLITIREPSIL